MSQRSPGGGGQHEAGRPTQPRRFAVVLAAKPGPVSSVQVAGLESDDSKAPVTPARPLRRFTIRAR